MSNRCVFKARTRHQSDFQHIVYVERFSSDVGYLLGYRSQGRGRIHPGYDCLLSAVEFEHAESHEVIIFRINLQVKAFRSDE